MDRAYGHGIRWLALNYFEGGFLLYGLNGHKWCHQIPKEVNIQADQV